MAIQLNTVIVPWPIIARMQGQNTVHNLVQPKFIVQMLINVLSLSAPYRMHCPTLITADADEIMGKPKSQLSLLLKPRTGFKRASSKPSWGGGADPTWLHPILLPSIYHTLFALYREHAREDNNKLSNLIGRLNMLSEVRLCEVVEVQRSVEVFL